MRRPGRPYSRVTLPKQRHHRHPHRGRQMADSTIVANVPARPRQPACQFEQIVKPRSFRERLLRTRRPLHRIRQRGRQFAKPAQRPVLPRRPREGMDHDRLPARHLVHWNPRRQTRRRPHLRGVKVHGVQRPILRQRRMKRKRQPAHRRPKLLVVRAVPGDNPVKLREPLHRPPRRLNPHQVQARRRNRVHAVRETHERLINGTNPNFRILRP